MKRFVFVFIILISSTFAEQTELLQTTYSFQNVSLNFLDWTSKTESSSCKKDFFYLEYEAGVGFSWGTFYMFADIENPTKSYNNLPMEDRRYVLKPILDIQIAQSSFYLYFQDYNIYSKTFYVSNFVSALAYKIQEDGLLFELFVGPHYQKSTYYSGLNGYMYGWMFNYRTKLLNENFSLTQWHEHEFMRDEEHYLFNNEPTGDGASNGTQGAVALWWHPNSTVTTGLQYRYADDKLGYHGYQNGCIYTIKYNF